MSEKISIANSPPWYFLIGLVKNPFQQDGIALKIQPMKYIIKSQKDGCYFRRFLDQSGNVELGRIQEAKIYSCKKDALKDIRKMEQCGQRIIAITRVGKNITTPKRPSSEPNF